MPGALSRRNTTIFRPGTLLLVAFIVFTAGCRPPETSAPAVDTAYTRTYSSKPATLTLRVNATRISTAQRLSVSFTATMPENLAIRFPEFADRLGELQIIDTDRAAPELAGPGRVKHRHTLILEPRQPGTITIPAFTIDITDSSGQLTARFITDPVEIEVYSLLDDQAGPADIRDIYDPVAQPWSTAAYILLGLALLGALLLMLAGILWYAKRRNRLPPPPPPEPPQTIARRDLDNLLRAGLLQQGRVKEFYQRLSDILRRYLEVRFHFKAPERTTEEFLLEIRDSRRLTGDQKKVLKAFLSHCDLVKFAAHVPAEKESEQAVRLAGQLIEQTSVSTAEKGG